MKKMCGVIYESPDVAIYDVLTEQGFGLSGGSTIEQIGGREDELDW